MTCPFGRPQDLMKSLGITYRFAVTQTRCKNWEFWCCENLPHPLPDWLQEMHEDPLMRIGYGLSERMAYEIVRLMEEEG